MLTVTSRYKNDICYTSPSYRYVLSLGMIHSIMGRRFGMEKNKHGLESSSSGSHTLGMCAGQVTEFLSLFPPYKREIIVEADS